MQKSFWWWQCSDRYITSLSPPPISPPPSFSTSLISLMVSVDVKHHVYLLSPFTLWNACINTCYCIYLPGDFGTECLAGERCSNHYNNITIAALTDWFVSSQRPAVSHQSCQGQKTKNPPQITSEVWFFVRDTHALTLGENWRGGCGGGGGNEVEWPGIRTKFLAAGKAIFWPTPDFEEKIPNSYCYV